MSVATGKPGTETRSILAPTGNRVRIFEEQRRKKDVVVKKPAEKPKKVVASPSQAKKAAAAEVAIVRSNVSADSSSDSSSSSSSSSSASSSRGSNVKSAGKSMGTGRTTNSNGVAKAAKVVPDEVVLPFKRCDWITPNSEPLYTCFHDEEWGVPVHDDIKLFELLVFSQALAELSWPVILNKRPIFRKLFYDFYPTSVANLDVETFLSKRVHRSTLLSELKVRAIVENANQLLKIQQEFGSFNNYIWRYVNHKPVKSGFRYARQIPAKTPKAEVISKDLLQRGFRCVGPTVVYSFMQVAGIVNDHLTTCFRYNQCSDKKDPRPQTDKSQLTDQSSPVPDSQGQTGESET